MKSVAIIIPALNAEDTIAMCLKSILDLDTKEVVVNIYVVDNNSIDNTAEIAKSFNVNVLSCYEKGRSFARNYGITHSDSEFVAFIDSDVCITPSWLQELLPILEKPTVGMVQSSIIPDGCNRLADFRRLKKYTSTNKTYIEAEGSFSQLPIINTAAALYKRSALTSANGFDSKLVRSEDLDLTIRLCIEGYSLGASLSAKAYVNYSQNKINFLVRSFMANFSSVSYMLNRLKIPRKLLLLELLNPIIPIVKGHFLFSLLNIVAGKAGVFFSFFNLTKNEPLSLNFKASKFNFTLMDISYNESIYSFSLTKRFYYSVETLIVYGLNNKRPLIFKHKEVIDFFSDYLASKEMIKVSSDPSDIIKLFLERLISSRVLIAK